MKQLQKLFTRMKKLWQACPLFLREVTRMIVIYMSAFLMMKMLCEAGTDNRVLAVLSVFYTTFSVLIMQADKIMRQYNFSQEGLNQLVEDIRLHDKIETHQQKLSFSSHHDLAETMEMLCDQILGKNTEKCEKHNEKEI
jgi:hypothetical protein